MAKQTSDRISEIASKALKTGKATMAQIKALAASALGQDESKGRRPAKKAAGAIVAGTTSGGTAAGNGMHPGVALAIGVVVAVVVFIGWKWWQSKHADKVAAPAAPEPAPEVQPDHTSDPQKTAREATGA